MEIKVTKLTDITLLHKANSFTSGKESHMSLLTAYKTRHTPCRTQLFCVEMTDIPLFCASQYVRSTQGANWYMRTRRTDRGAEDFRKVCETISDELAETGGDSGNVERVFNSCMNLSNTVKDLSKRFDRYAPTDLMGILNAEAIMNMSAKRLCAKASTETRDIWRSVLEEVKKTDPDLESICRRPCVEHGLCREAKPCGYMNTRAYAIERVGYKMLFRK